MDPLLTQTVVHALQVADERFDDKGQAKVRGLLDAGDPKGEVRDAWHAPYQVVRQIYTINVADTGAAFVARLAADLRDQAGPPEVRLLGRTFTKWQSQIAAWHRSHRPSRPAPDNSQQPRETGKEGSVRNDELPQLPNPINCSTPADPTGHSSPRTHAEIRSARKAIIEPVFWQMKAKQNAGQLRLRGLAGAQGEFMLHAICHNLRKLANANQPATC